MLTRKTTKSPGMNGHEQMRRKKQQRDWLPLSFLAPAAIVLIIFIFIPLIRSLILSFFDANLLRPDAGEFVWLDNYTGLAQNPRFWNSLRVTVIYTASGVVLAYLIGLLTALLLNRQFKLRWLARIAIIIPWAIPEVVAVMVFKWILDAQFGILNHLLLGAGIIDEPIAWLSHRSLALLVAIFATAWISYPLATLILLAGLQTVPEELYESAQLDGAGWFKQFRYVTFPLLKFVNIVLVILLTLDTFRRTTLIYTMTGGGPQQATETLPVWTYIEAFSNHNLGGATAIGITVMLILAAGTLVYFFGFLWKANK